jgi:hypothetical protein
MPFASVPRASAPRPVDASGVAAEAVDVTAQLDELARSAMAGEPPTAAEALRVVGRLDRLHRRIEFVKISRRW